MARAVLSKVSHRSDGRLTMPKVMPQGRSFIDVPVAQRNLCLPRADRSLHRGPNHRGPS